MTEDMTFINEENNEFIFPNDVKNKRVKLNTAGQYGGERAVSTSHHSYRLSDDDLPKTIQFQNASLKLVSKLLTLASVFILRNVHCTQSIFRMNKAFSQKDKIFDSSKTGKS